MMHRISLFPFAGYIPIFDLQDCIDPGEPSGEPCRFKVGPRRFLDITVLPKHFKADIWSNKNGPVRYFVDLPIPEQRDNQGRQIFDAVDFLQQLTGESYPCPAEQFLWGMRLGLWSHTFLTTEYGAAAAHSSHMPEVLEVLLYLMQATTQEKLETQLSKLHLLGMVMPGEEA